MAFPFGQPTTFTDLLVALENHLSERTGIPKDGVFASLATDEDHLKAPPRDQFLVIRPMDFPVDMGSTASGGRSLTGHNSVWDFTLFCRLNSDQEFRSPALLKNKQGVFNMVFNLINSGQMFIPANEAGDACVLREPGRILGWRMPTKAFMGSTSPWFVVPTRWELKFTLAISA